MKMFDYIYYRVSKVYLKWDGRSGITGIMALTMMQSLLITEAFTIILRCFYSRDEIKELPIRLSYIALVICVVVVFFNTKRYYNTFNKYRFYWKEEPKNLFRLKGGLVLLSLILPWLFLFILDKYF